MPADGFVKCVIETLSTISHSQCHRSGRCPVSFCSSNSAPLVAVDPAYSSYCLPFLFLFCFFLYSFHFGAPLPRHRQYFGSLSHCIRLATMQQSLHSGVLSPAVRCHMPLDMYEQPHIQQRSDIPLPVTVRSVFLRRSVHGLPMPMCVLSIIHFYDRAPVENTKCNGFLRALFRPTLT